MDIPADRDTDAPNCGLELGALGPEGLSVVTGCEKPGEVEADDSKSVEPAETVPMLGDASD